MDELERIIVGRLFLQPDYSKLAHLDKSLFSSEKLRRIIAAVEESSKNGNKYDELLISQKTGIELSEIFGLTDGIHKISPENFIEHVKKLRQKKCWGKLFKITEEQKKLYLKGLSPDEAKLFKVFEEIKDTSSIIPHSPQPILTKLDTIEPERVEWLWHNRIPLRKITLLVGDPGDGKSFLTIYLTARVTTGTAWPEIGERTVPGSVLILTAEDGLADTVRVRADAAQADVSKIGIIEGVKDGQTEEFFNVLDHLPALEKAIKIMGDVRLIVIDPLTSYLGQMETNRTAPVRAALAPLAALAEKHNVAVVAVSHLNKNEAMRAIYRTTGSLAFTAAARAVWAVVRDPEDESKRRRFFTPLKTNLSIDPTTLAFTIEDAAVIFESSPVDVTAEDAMSPEGSKESGLVVEACSWLKEALEDGPITSRTILKMGEDNGYSEATLRRAKKRINIVVAKKGFSEGGEWLWRLDNGE